MGNQSHRDRRIHEVPHISIEFKTVFDLAPNGTGWKVHSVDEEKLKKLREKKIVTLGVLGSYDAGKTYLCNQLASRNLPSGPQFTTNGIQICYPENSDIHFGLIDVPGSQEALPVNDGDLGAKLPFAGKKCEIPNYEYTTEDHQNVNYINRFHLLHSDAKLTHSLKEKFIVESVDIIILVTNKLSASDQEMIYKNINYYKESFERKKNSHKSLYVVHNFKMLTTIDSVEEQIEKDIKRCFDVEKTPMFNDGQAKNKNLYMYQDSFNICHLVLANDNSPAGAYYNEQTMNFVKKKFQVAENKTTLNLIEAFGSFCNENLKKMLGQDIKLTFDKDKKAFVNTSGNEIKIDGLAWSSLGEIVSSSDAKFAPKYSIITCELDKNTQKVIVDVETLDCIYIPLGKEIPEDKSYMQRTLNTKDGVRSLKLIGKKILSKMTESASGEAIEGTLINHSRGEGQFELTITLVKDKEKKSEEYVDLGNGIARFVYIFCNSENA